MAIGVLHRPPQRGGQLGHRKFGRVDQRFRCGHFDSAFKGLAQVRDFRPAATIPALVFPYTLLYRVLCLWEFRRKIMMRWLVWFPLGLLRWTLAIIGAVALLLAAMVVTPLAHPPELKSISQTARSVDRSNMPALEHFSARDGTQLAYRHYPARGQAAGRVAILVHGSSGSSAAAHALADALAAHGVETYAPDIRGHGGSGTRGDIGRIGQLEDDIAGLGAPAGKTSPD